MSAALPIPNLCLATDSSLDHGEFVERVAMAVEGGVTLVQLWDKSLPDSQLLDLTKALLDAAGGQVKVIVNDQADVALAAEAHGVQSGEDGLAVAEARKTLGNHALIGRSVHSIPSAIRAEADGADFLVVGTMYASRTHPGEAPAGSDLMRNISRECRRIDGCRGVRCSGDHQHIGSGIPWGSR